MTDIDKSKAKEFMKKRGIPVGDNEDVSNDEWAHFEEYVVSVCNPSAHDVFVATLSQKNFDEFMLGLDPELDIPAEETPTVSPSPAPVAPPAPVASPAPVAPPAKSPEPSVVKPTEPTEPTDQIISETLAASQDETDLKLEEQGNQSEDEGEK